MVRFTFSIQGGCNVSANYLRACSLLHRSNRDSGPDRLCAPSRCPIQSGQPSVVAACGGSCRATLSLATCRRRRVSRSVGHDSGLESVGGSAREKRILPTSAACKVGSLHVRPLEESAKQIVRRCSIGAALGRTCLGCGSAGRGFFSSPVASFAGELSQGCPHLGLRERSRRGLSSSGGHYISRRTLDAQRRRTGHTAGGIIAREGSRRRTICNRPNHGELRAKSGRITAVGR